MTFAFECYGDEDVFLFLQIDQALGLSPRHAYGQGNVVNAVLTGKAQIGMVDEDPGRSHHAQRDRMTIAWTEGDVELRANLDRLLIILKPELEQCFLAAARSVELSTTFTQGPSPMARALTRPDDLRHADFRRELREHHALSIRKNLPTFLTRIERAVRTHLQRPDSAET